ncbi:hypothetical protein Mterra_02248 [Calidithermus terrae]|uniref:Uncharacterized protein n=1 Tax=Calidithermus terrae TaxID=1408545 RepID=A0A399EN06_9DEIN|nr:hypothetical protein [Calidithermus terrae]RIH83531.1 hypothetical protein Mterra_02248 [Calidithermus terrae]
MDAVRKWFLRILGSFTLAWAVAVVQAVLAILDVAKTPPQIAVAVGLAVLLGGWVKDRLEARR